MTVGLCETKNGFHSQTNTQTKLDNIESNRVYKGGGIGVWQ